MSGGKQISAKNIFISVEADQKIEDIKREFGKEMLEEAKKIAEKRAGESKSEEVTVEGKDIMEAWEIIKNRKQGSKCYNFLSCELPPHKCGGFLLQRRATQRH